MAIESTGTGDVDRTLKLLWRQQLGEPQGSRGPKQKMSVDDVVMAAVALADEEGVEAVTMRRIAERLGLGVMSVYTYVPSKSELIDLMVDWVVGEQGTPEHVGSPRERLTRLARLQWDEYLRHPWLLEVDTSRPPIGPNSADRYEWQLGTVEGIGLDDIEMDQIVALVVGFVSGPARGRLNAQRIEQSTGLSDLQWWETNAPLLEQIMDGSRYPVSGRVGQAAGEAYNATANPELTFEFGLERILDGIDLLIQSKAH
ncbi:TetR/AcrR family transcriptional regulator [Arthrobacter tecti]